MNTIWTGDKSENTDGEIKMEFRNKWTNKEDTLNTLINISKTLDELQIEWSLISGTLLGAVRHGGFIPWDVDIDISINTWNRADELISKLIGNGYTVQNKRNNQDDYYKIKAGVSIDIFHHERIDDNIVRSYGHRQCVYTDVPIEFWFPYSTIKFEDLILPCPNKPTEYLDRLYLEWNEYALSKWNGKMVSIDKLKELGLL